MLRRKVKKDHPNDEDDLLKDEDNHTIEDDPLKEDNTQPLEYLAFAAFLMKNLNILFVLEYGNNKFYSLMKVSMINIFFHFSNCS